MSKSIVYEKLLNVLFDEDALARLEWAVGACFAGDFNESKKFVVLCGGPRSGKTTVINILTKAMEYSGIAVGWLSLDGKLVINIGPLLAKEGRGVCVNRDADLTKFTNSQGFKELVLRQAVPGLNVMPFLETNKMPETDNVESWVNRSMLVVPMSERVLTQSAFDAFKAEFNYSVEYDVIRQRCIDRYTSLGPDY